jgi:Beta-galactosidase
MPLIARTISRKRITLILAAIVLAAPAFVIAISRGNPSAAATGSPLLFGTLDTQISSISADKQAGVSVAMFDLDWASFEPKQGQFDASYISGMKSFLSSYRAAGMLVTLGLGLQDPPAWVFSLPDSSYVDQTGAAADEADFVFSEPVRQAAALYLQQVAAALPLSDFWAVRLTSGGDEEMLYPAGGSYWAFSQSALTGTDLPATMTANPFPSWRPGQSGLTQSQVDQWVSWYVRGLDDVTAWQMTTLSGLGFTGYYQLVTPGSGTRPDTLAAQERSNLPDSATTGVGAVWDRYYAMLPDKSNVVAYVSSVADMSGNDDSCQASDESLPLTSTEMDSWSATRWISRIAAANGLLVAGENPGYGQPASLDSHYRDTTSHGMMADAIRQASTCKFQVFYWAHDEDFSNGIVARSLYQQNISLVSH